MGQIMNMDAPVIGAPDGEIVQGENMDVAGENEKVKKDSASHNQLFRAITPNLYDRIATDMQSRHVREDIVANLKKVRAQNAQMKVEK